MIFDAHMHLGTLPSYYSPDRASLESVLKRMDYIGISHGMQMHMGGFFDMKDFAYEKSIEIFERSSHRIYFGLIYDPTNPIESIKWIDKAKDEPGLVCIKIHPSWHKTYADDDGYREIWDYAQKTNLPIVSHTWTVSNYNPTQKFSVPERFLRFLQEYPEVELVMGHGGGRYDGHLKALEIAQQFDNVFLDTSGDVNAYGLLKKQVDTISANRILFGSDVSMIDINATIGKIFACDISLKEKKKILWENAIRLFKLDI